MTMTKYISVESEYELFSQIVSAHDFYTILPFYLYRAAPIETCSLSFDFQSRLSNEEKSSLYLRLLDNRISSIKATTSIQREADWIEQNHLNDEGLVCDKEKGIYLIGSRIPDDNSYALLFDTLLRRVRNSIAHGRVAREGDFLILEDKSQDHKNRKKQRLTARFVLLPETLVEWIQILQASI